MTQAGLQDNSERETQKQKLTLTLLCLQSIPVIIEDA